MIKQKFAAVVMAVLVTLGASGGSARAATVAPPGNSGVDQYVEVIPSAGGPVPTPKGGSESGGNALSPQTARRLRAQGSDGRALSAIVESTAPAGARGSRRGRADSDRTGSTPSRSGSQASPAVPTAVSSLSLGSDVDGMGLLLPALLVGSAAVIGAIFLTRRRRSQ